MFRESGGIVQRPIAVLDSGVGGLTVVKELIKQLPNEDIVYFGDTFRTPYGPRTAEEVVRFTEEIVQYLLSYNPKLIVIACNTATAVALEKVSVTLSIPVIGVIAPGARAAISNTKTKYIGVIGTEGTIKSKAYDFALQQLQKDILIVSAACPAFVPLVERGQYQSPQAYSIVYDEIAHLRSYPIDCLILGCTHYPFLADIIAEVMGKSVRLIQSAEETTLEVKSILLGIPAFEVLSDNQTQAQQQCSASFSSKLNYVSAEQINSIRYRMICSGDVTMFRTIVKEWLGPAISDTNTIYMNHKIL